MQKSPFSEPLASSTNSSQNGRKPRKAGKWFRCQSFLVQKSPFSELLEFTRKFIPESKIALPCGASSKFRRLLRSNTPGRSNLKILMKIALSCGASSKFRRFLVQNRPPVRSILEISASFKQKLRSRAEHPQKFGRYIRLITVN